MFFNCDLRKGTVYLPTAGKIEPRGGYMDMEPVAVIPVTDAAALRQALRDAIARGNPPIPLPTGRNYPEPVVLKYAGVKTWSAFMRGTTNWHFKEQDGVYEIVRSREGPYGGWVEDPDQRIRFAPGTSAETVIERMIAILQSAAGG